MRPIDLPESAPEKWDRLADEVTAGKGNWVCVMKTPESHRGQNNKAKEALERRGLVVEVRSRLGHNSVERPWDGWWTFAKLVK